MPAMQRGFTENAMPGDLMASYLKARGEGGVALIFSESVAPDHPSGFWQSRFCQLTESSFPRWRHVVDSVKGHGRAFRDAALASGLDP